ncbi:MAG: hypothetical protein J0I98_12895 [Mesorhizobium sp.]|nr:hypothetical protein [Mesorhizobium sp.]MBN9243680.1 hypothetical protein [Mesorhizobium sp.]MBN9271866.1 hypothetical protein [Mesorhizobium sp.]
MFAIHMRRIGKTPEAAQIRPQGRRRGHKTRLVYEMARNDKGLGDASDGPGIVPGAVAFAANACDEGIFGAGAIPAKVRSGFAFGIA